MKAYSKQDFITTEFPSVQKMIELAKEISKDWEYGQTAFCRERGVDSERAFKEQCKTENRISRHAAIGYNSVEETCSAMKWLYEELEKKDCTLDRVGVLLDVSMGISDEYKDHAMVGSGLVLHSEEEWVTLGQAAPFMIHFGDNMIGSLRSLENLKLAFKAGTTSVGNFSQYFSYSYPFQYDMNKRTLDACLAICIMGLNKERGMVMHSNLDDGFAAAFNDLVTVLAWARVEKYLAEDLMKAKLGHCFGNLFSSPILRMTFSLALDEINGGDSCGTMIYGNTTDYTRDFVRNNAVVNGYIIGDMIGQIHRPTGHAMSSVPVSEAARIPTKEEILDAQVMSNEIERYARAFEPYINWAKVEEDKQLLLQGADVVYGNIMRGLADMGIDMKNPAEIMITCKELGPEYLERSFGLGEPSEEYANGRKPIWPTDMVRSLEKIQNQCFRNFNPDKSDLAGLKVILCATDIHEFGKVVVGNVLRRANARIIDIGRDASPGEAAEMALETDSHVILVSSYNGIARTFAKALLRQMEDLGVEAEIFMGGLLNENDEGGNIPVDVTEELEVMGVHCVKEAESLPAEIKRVFA
ncbi:cobalamin B12-binding domain-containing protein [Emergencia sp.]|uniref:cobalamin B12-binding domain-containing protein n=1 Tax=Emergencia sp. TaxID=1926557 RepID=UPI003AF05902